MFQEYTIVTSKFLADVTTNTNIKLKVTKKVKVVMASNLNLMEQLVSLMKANANKMTRARNNKCCKLEANADS